MPAACHGSSVRLVPRDTVNDGHDEGCVVPPPPHRRRDRDGAIAHLGGRVAFGLVLDDRGSAEDGSGWVGALQTAADYARNDPDVLRIADEIHSAAHDLRTRAAARAYAASTLVFTPDGPAPWLLHGMLERLDELDDR